MTSYDLENAFDPKPGRIVDNFTCLLLRLIAKADSENKEKHRKGFPVEVTAVEIYKGDCPYVDEDKTVVDWIKIDDLAHVKITKVSKSKSVKRQTSVDVQTAGYIAVIMRGR